MPAEPRIAFADDGSLLQEVRTRRAALMNDPKVSGTCGIEVDQAPGRPGGGGAWARRNSSAQASTWRRRRSGGIAGMP